ncbi:class I SAM-dependent methyltransferase [Magnetovibrio sp. PR-2]|uniref:class I SAM-dependent methyltransferase n=1 Tax=Magnetovibrio sp. PR-2 TaxID=3120356 RepID=UPI002FCE2FB5
MSDIYSRWRDVDCIRGFANKGAEDFFKSETVFIDSMAHDAHSVLDIGCASGRMIELLSQKFQDLSYTGVDIVEENIRLARENYPDFAFHCTNALEFENTDTFDLVNATGVMQHEVKFEELINRMINWSNKYVLFDVKLANVDEHVVDIERSYCGKEHRLNYNLFCLPKFLEYLHGCKGLSKISLFGYETGLNNRTVVPPNVSYILSAGFLLELGDLNGGKIEVDSQLPISAQDRLSANSIS